VDERGVDDPVGRGRAGAQAVEVVQRAAVDLRPGGGDRGGRGIRAGEPEDLMARPDQLGDDGGADEAGRAGEENTHERSPMSVAVISLAAR
jgi:hypothetical protein